RGVGVAFHDPQDVLDQRPVAQSRVQDEWGIDLVTPAQYVYEGGFFVGEVVKHPGVGEPRVGGDVAEGDRAVAGAGEQFGGGVDDALPSALALGHALPRALWIRHGAPRGLLHVRAVAASGGSAVRRRDYDFHGRLPTLS